MDLATGNKPPPPLTANGKPDRLGGCNWVSSQRLVCNVYGLVKADAELLPFTRLLAVDRNGKNPQLLSTKSDEYTRGIMLGGGYIVDWLPDEDGAVLMTRLYLPNDKLNTRLASTTEGLGVDWMDTKTIRTKSVEPAARDAVSYVSDGLGMVRIVGRTQMTRGGEQATGIIHYSYRKKDSREWHDLAVYQSQEHEGFLPLAIDHELDVAYGLKKNDGRICLYTVALDGSLKETLIYSNPNVDVDDLIQIGRRNRVVGTSYAADVRHSVYFDATTDRLMKSLSRALPGRSISVVDASVDEQILIVIATSDDDPGAYYIFNRQTKELRTFLVVRSQLEGVKLAKVQAITYPAADGTLVPGYLTLPPGAESAKGLAAIVLPHGGPSARDEWGFDWLSQFYAARGYAVLQPNFRGSAGYGDAWLRDRGFKSWRIAIGDVLDAGRWLISQGIADPHKLGVVGWSYGGYAALQSAVVEPGFFKAVVAIAPVTDLESLTEERRHWTNYDLTRKFVGDGPHIREGSPARNAEKIKVPVLMFQGTFDRNVSINQSRLMDAQLDKVGAKHQLVTWDGLDHYLEDGDARAEMLRKSDEFLRSAFAAGH
jgi:dipeptidyl aminopeptidase/acylaminoacyl peptidase